MPIEVRFREHDELFWKRLKKCVGEGALLWEALIKCNWMREMQLKVRATCYVIGSARSAKGSASMMRTRSVVPAGNEP